MKAKPFTLYVWWNDNDGQTAISADLPDICIADDGDGKETLYLAGDDQERENCKIAKTARAGQLGSLRNPRVCVLKCVKVEVLAARAKKEWVKV